MAPQGARPLKNRLLSFFALARITTLCNARKTPTLWSIEKANIRHAQQLWGFVAPRTQSYLPWDCWTKPYVLSQPTDWFHEVFRQDDMPYRQRRVDLLSEWTGRRTPPEAFS
jgi:hypothetical protein